MSIWTERTASKAEKLSVYEEAEPTVSSVAQFRIIS